MSGRNERVSRSTEGLDRIQHELGSDKDGESLAFGNQVNDCGQSDVAPQLFGPGIPEVGYNL